jgi:hypothetical protein
MPLPKGLVLTDEVVDTPPAIGDKPRKNLPVGLSIVEEPADMPPAEKPPAVPITGMRQWLNMGKEGIESAIETGLPTAAGITAGVLAAPAGLAASGAAFGAVEGVTAKLRDLFMRPDKESREFKQIARDTLFSAMVSKFGPEAGNAFLRAARGMTGSSLNNLLGLFAYGAGEATAGAGSSVLSDVAAMPLGGSGPSMEKALVEGGLTGLTSIPAKMANVAARRAPDSDITRAAEAMGIRGQVPEITLEAPGSAKRALAEYLPGRNTEDIGRRSTAAIQSGLETQFPAVPMEAPAAGAVGPFPTMPMRDLNLDVRNTAALTRGNQLFGLAPTVPVAPTIQGARGPAQQASADITGRLLDVVEPGLGAAPAAGRQYGAPQLVMTQNAKRVIGGRLQQVVDEMATITNNNYIPTTQTGSVADSLAAQAEGSALPKRFATLARRVSDELNATSGGRGMLNATNVVSDIQELNRIAMTTTDPQVKRAAKALETAFRSDLHNQIAAVASPADATRLSAAMTEHNKAYLNISRLEDAIKQSSDGGRIDPDKLYSNLEKTAPKMTAGMADPMLAEAQGFLSSQAARAPKAAMAAATGKKAPAPTTADEVIFAGREIVDIGNGVKAPVSTAQSVSKWVAKNQAIMARLSPQARAQIQNFIDAGQNRLPAQSEQLLSIAKQTSGNDPLSMTNIARDPNISPATIRELTMAQTPLQRTSMGSAAMRGAAMPSGELDPLAMMEYTTGLSQPTAMVGPSREKLAAMHTPGQLASLEQTDTLLRNRESLDRQLNIPSPQSMVQSLRANITGPGGMAGSVGNNIGGKIGQLLGVIGTLSGVNLAPRVLEFLSSRNFSPEAVRQIEALVRSLQTKTATTGGEVMK